MSAQMATLILAWLAIILLGLGLAGILRRVQDLEFRVRGDQGRGGRLGERAPNVDLSPPFAVMFFQEGCSVCESSIVAVERHLSTAGRAVRDRTFGVLSLSNGTPPHWWHPEVFAQTASETMSSEFGVQAFPWMVAVDVHNLFAFDGPLAPSERVVDAISELRRIFETSGSVEKGTP